MKYIGTVMMLLMALACNNTDKDTEQPLNTMEIEGTWKLLSGTLIEKGDTTITDYTIGRSFVKIINKTHFAFLQHDLKKGADSTASYSSGGGTYQLTGNQYTEHLEYCTDRNWEGNDFSFTLTIKGDTLIQQGIEKVAEAGISRENIEKYIRYKKP